MKEPNNSEIKKRLHKTALKYALILGIAVIYLALVCFADIGLVCPIYAITGFSCPSCGISRMFISLLRLDFVSAFWYNPFLFITGPFVLAYLIFSDVKYVLYENRQMGKWEIFVWIEFVLALAYGILRNIFPI